MSAVPLREPRTLAGKLVRMKIRAPIPIPIPTRTLIRAALPTTLRMPMPVPMPMPILTWKPRRVLVRVRISAQMEIDPVVSSDELLYPLRASLLQEMKVVGY